METSLKMQVVMAMPVVRPFLAVSQRNVMCDSCRGEEKEFFMQKLVDLAQQIQFMPKTYEQDGMGDDAIITLHYFNGGSDWYITEKDMDGGIQQAFGYAILNGDDECAELGYISIEELTRHGVELDLHFTPCTLGALKAKRAQRDDSTAAEAVNLNPWVVVSFPGTDRENIIQECATFKEAMSAKKQYWYDDNGLNYDDIDIMKRLDDGTLTTEF